MAMGMVSVPYAIPHFQEELVVVEPPLPVGAWRAVAAGQNAFAVECFIDELAHAAGADPVEYRLGLLSDSTDSTRARNVLQLAAEKAGWGRAPEENRALGVAQYFSFGSWVAQVAEVSVEQTRENQNRIKVHKVVCVIDCGQCVNPDAVRAQMEGAIAMGVSVALKERVLFKEGKVTQATYQDYPILTFAEMPQVEIHIVPSDHPPGGVGEPGVPPVAPAVANAWYAATQQRLRALPMLQSES
jgi:CO/xanthine dehydrogenase Mo-binding subunit